jgi:quinohemoprotein ethanol dehydrogenase
MGTSAASVAAGSAPTIDYRTQAKRVLTFVIGGKGTLPPAKSVALVASEDPGYRPDPALAARGADTFGRYCVACHGVEVVSGGDAPDLRASPIPPSAEAFASVVHEGALVENGMPRFDEFDESVLGALRQYIRSRAADLRASPQPSMR